MVANNGSTISNGNRHSGQLITLNIHCPQTNLIQSMQFDVQMFIGEICQTIHQHLSLPIDQDRENRLKFD